MRRGYNPRNVLPPSPPPGPQRGHRDAVEVTSSTMLDAARDPLAGGRAGNKVVSAGPPVAIMEAPVAFSYLKDLVPARAGKRGVSLEAAEYKSSAACLTVGYVNTVANERVNPSGSEPPLSGAAPFRDHALFFEWGAGTSVYSAQMDCGEGNACAVSGANIFTRLIDWSFARNLSGYVYEQLETECSVSFGANPQSGTMTVRVMAPYQVEVDLLDPPTIQEQLRLLAAACNTRVYLE